MLHGNVDARQSIGMISDGFESQGLQPQSLTNKPNTANHGQTFEGRMRRTKNVECISSQEVDWLERP